MGIGICSLLIIPSFNARWISREERPLAALCVLLSCECDSCACFFFFLFKSRSVFVHCTRLTLFSGRLNPSDTSILANCEKNICPLNDALFCEMKNRLWNPKIDRKQRKREREREIERDWERKRERESLPPKLLVAISLVPPPLRFLLRCSVIFWLDVFFVSRRVHASFVCFRCRQDTRCRARSCASLSLSVLLSLSLSLILYLKKKKMQQRNQKKKNKKTSLVVSSHGRRALVRW